VGEVEWINVRRAARLLGTDERTVRRMIARGVFRSAHQLIRGGAWRVDRSEVDAFLAGVTPALHRRPRRGQTGHGGNDGNGDHDGAWTTPDDGC
jgi:excisionase family DNA binding protein